MVTKSHEPPSKKPLVLCTVMHRDPMIFGIQNQGFFHQVLTIWDSEPGVSELASYITLRVQVLKQGSLQD